MSEAEDFNAPVIEEFRANGGVVGGMFEGMPMLLLHHKGAKTGTDRVNPLAYQVDGDRYVVFASKAGAPTHPAWYLNLVANPDTSIELGAETFDVLATEAPEDERARIWNKQKEVMPQFAEYEQTAGGRVIPVIILTKK
jgi:deazaflavin-dependent oxidoreductase (nitroreductase family)